MANDKKKPLIVSKSVKHVFNADEAAELSRKLLSALDDHANAEKEFDSIKAQYKAKITEAESRVGTVSATMRAGFEMRVKDCFVVFAPEEGKKTYFLADDEEMKNPVGIETMTPDDFQQDLIQAESAFDKKKEIVLWDAGDDHGRLIVGLQKDRWYSALRCNTGSLEIKERLDSEQMAFKNRFDAIKKAAARCCKWVEDNFGKENGASTIALIAPAIDKEKEKAE